MENYLNLTVADVLAEEAGINVENLTNADLVRMYESELYGN